MLSLGRNNIEKTISTMAQHQKNIQINEMGLRWILRKTKTKNYTFYLPNTKAIKKERVWIKWLHTCGFLTLQLIPGERNGCRCKKWNWWAVFKSQPCPLHSLCINIFEERHESISYFPHLKYRLNSKVAWTV